MLCLGLICYIYDAVEVVAEIGNEVFGAALPHSFNHVAHGEGGWIGCRGHGQHAVVMVGLHPLQQSTLNQSVDCCRHKRDWQLICG